MCVCIRIWYSSVSLHIDAVVCLCIIVCVHLRSNVWSYWYYYFKINTFSVSVMCCLCGLSVWLSCAWTRVFVFWVDRIQVWMWVLLLSVPIVWLCALVWRPQRVERSGQTRCSRTPLAPVHLSKVKRSECLESTFDNPIKTCSSRQATPETHATTHLWTPASARQDKAKKHMQTNRTKNEDTRTRNTWG